MIVFGTASWFSFKRPIWWVVAAHGALWPLSILLGVVVDFIEAIKEARA